MGPLLLVITTLIWGTAFVAQKAGADALGPFAVTVLRNILGGLFLLALIFCRPRPQRSTLNAQPSTPNRSRAIRAGILCGIPLFAAMLAQQIGIGATTPGVSAFLTANYVLIVPLLGAALTRCLPRAYVWCGAVAALGGTALICFGGAEAATGLRLGAGEAWTLLCALLFSVQMLVVDRYARACDVLVMSATQLFTCAVCGLPFLLLPSEASRLAAVAVSDWLGPIAYLGVLSSGIAYTLQNYGQARTPPALAAIILSLESVVGALSGWLWRGDVLTTRQFAGCAVVFAAVVGSQLWEIAAARAAANERNVL